MRDSIATITGTRQLLELCVSRPTAAGVASQQLGNRMIVDAAVGMFIFPESPKYLHITKNSSHKVSAAAIIFYHGPKCDVQGTLNKFDAEKENSVSIRLRDHQRAR